MKFWHNWSLYVSCSQHPCFLMGERNGYQDVLWKKRGIKVKSWLYSRLKHVIARWVGFIYEIPMNTYSMPKVICNPLAMTTITSKKICRHLNFIEFHRRLTPNKTTFQKITGHLPPIVGRWINSTLGHSNVMFFLPVSFAWIFWCFFGELLTNIFPQSEQ